MAGYTRQSVADIIANAVIKAAPVNAEFNAIRDAFNSSTGHKHDGSSSEGAFIAAIADPDGKNKAVVDTTNNRISFFSEVSGTAVEQVRIQDGAIVPVTDNDIDLGSSGLKFKNLYVDGIGEIGSVTILGGTVDNVVIGGTTPAAGTFTNLNATGTTTITSADINGGLIDNTVIGGSNPAAGNFTTASTTGQATLATVDINGGTIDGTVIGGNTASPITGTTINSTGGFTGDLTGDVSGNVTSAGTSGFNNITASGTIQGALTGNVQGNVTATTGSSQFNNVTINGTLNMDGATTATIQNLTDPTNAQDAATKNYVDVGLAGLVDSSPAALDTLNELAAAINDDASFSTTMTTALAGKVADTGDTMTGDLIMSGATVTGLPLPTSNSEAANKQYADQQDALQVTRAGDTMSGSLGMGGNKITNLGTPTANTDAVTKVYVDGILQSATAASSSAAAAATSEANAATSESNASTSEQLAQDWAVKTSGTVDGSDFSAKYWATQGNVPVIATNIADINSVATSITNVNLAATNIAAVNTVATNINNVTDFFDTYFVSANQPTGSNVTEGDLWFDTTSQVLKVRSSSGFQNAGSSVNGTAERRDYTASANQTSFAAVYDTNYVDVYLNGVKLAPTDFTATDGANVVLASAAASGDTISIVSYGTFELADHYNKTTVDALIDDVETLALAGI